MLFMDFLSLSFYLYFLSFELSITGRPFIVDNYVNLTIHFKVIYEDSLGIITINRFISFNYNGT